jgi:hypothetical protein
MANERFWRIADIGRDWAESYTPLPVTASSGSMARNKGCGGSKVSEEKEGAKAGAQASGKAKFARAAPLDVTPSEKSELTRLRA